MPSTFGGIELGKRSLNAHQQGLTTIGHNLANASTEGYSRQRVKLQSAEALYYPALSREERPGQVGQGVDVASVERVRDELLEKRIVAQGSVAGYWKARDSYILQLEQIHQEPYDTSVRAQMDQFWEGWQELSLRPEGEAERQAVLRRGETLADGINRRFERLDQLQTMLDEDVMVSVGEINSILQEIGGVNEQIVKSEALGDNPNDLYDRRDSLVNTLSDYVPVSVDGRDPDEFTVFTGGRHLVQGRVVTGFDLQPNPEKRGLHDVVWEGSEELFLPDSGKLGAVLELRDVDLRGEILSLDEMSLAFSDLVNGIHREGWSASGDRGEDFFTARPIVDNLSGNFDNDGDGTLDSTYVYRLTGINALNTTAPVGIAGELRLNGPEGDVLIPYTAQDTVGAILERINRSDSELTARLDRSGRLELRAGMSGNASPDFVIRHVEDSGSFLTGYAGLLGGSGPDSAYDWGATDAVLSLRPGGSAYAVTPTGNPSAYLAVNETLVTDPTRIASGLSSGGERPGSGDNRAASDIASLRHRPVLAGRTPTFDDWFSLAAADVGLKGEVAASARDSQDLVMKDLEDLRQSVSGVNMDEEFAEMIKFQHGYNAAARFVTTMDEMLETIINRLGV